MKPVRIGNIEVTRVEEMIWLINPRHLFPQLDFADLERHREWLVPNFCTEDLTLKLSMHMFVVRTPEHTIIVDTCIGDDRKRAVEVWNMKKSDFLQRLAAAGVDPAKVDYVFCTHMHVDHVGWNTRLENGRWVPTFPNARYLFHRREWEHWKVTEDENAAEVVRDSLLPIEAAGLTDLVEDGYAIEEGIVLEPTPGHTPGHCCVHLSSNGAEAVITGDMIHHPSQIVEPHWWSRACWDREMAVRTRRDFLEKYADTPTLILGTHFAPPTALHIVRRGEAFHIRL